MHWRTVDKKKESVITNADIAIEKYWKWIFSKPLKRYLAGRNERGHNIMYLHGTFGGGIRGRRMIFTAFKKGWYAHEQQMD